jgi:DNA gyrase subunit A
MDIGEIQTVDIDRQMRTAYLDYAMSVIVSRALPDARDGLKPVQRRILFGMHDLGTHANSPFKKSARIVGEVMGKYHPHGDASIYDAMARMAQNFSMRYVLVDGQGNFGSIDGDSPAAMRYTEARLGALADELLADINKNTVTFNDNFDGTLQEPSVLPARLPNLLLNGSSGIAVGMATNLPPHNLREIVAALVYVIDNYDDLDNITVEDLIQYMQGPDFPTGGEIVGVEGIRQAYSTGRGRLVVRGTTLIEEFKADRMAIIITEIPYQVNKSTLIERIAELAMGGRINQISDLRDESDRHGTRIVVELKRGAQPRQVLNQLYKFSPLQSTFGVQNLALVEGEPRLLSLRRSLAIFIEHRREVITRRTQFELDKAKNRAHILEGLLIALDNLDAVIQTIRESPDVDQAKARLVEGFKLSEPQAVAILDMQLRRLAALERKKIEDEYHALLEQIAYFEDLLANPGKILGVIKQDLLDMSAKYGDDRRTRISHDAEEEVREEDLVVDEEILISITQHGYIKRVSASLYRTQGRGRVGVSGQTMREEDEVSMLIPAHTLHTILFFSDRGKVYSERAYRIPSAGRTDRGVSIYNVLALGAGESVTAAVVVDDFKASRFCILATTAGKVKRMPLSEFASVRPSGLLAIHLTEGAQLKWVRLTSGEDDVMLVTKNGLALRQHEAGIRLMGRQAAGVTGIRLRPTDAIASMEVVEMDGLLLVVTENGFGKCTLLDQYTSHSRGGKGIKTVNQGSLEEIGRIADARVVQPEDEVTLISTGGVVLRLKVNTIRTCGRASRGVRLMNLSRGGVVASIARMTPIEKQELI